MSESQGIFLTTPEEINMFSLLAMRKRLEMEIKGLRFRIRTGPRVKRMLGLPTTASLKTTLKHLNMHIQSLGGPATLERSAQADTKDSLS